MADIIGPDKILADLQLKLSKTKDPAARSAIQEQITARQVEITQQFGGSAGFGGMGYVVPGSTNALKGKTVLAPSFTEGVYSAVKYDPVTGAPIDLTLQKTSDPSAKGTDRYDPNATNLKTYYDASGNPIAPSKLAQTLEGQNMAKAGWDIGYGPGKIGPGPTDFASGYVPPGTNDGMSDGSSGNRFFGSSNGTSSTGLTATDVATQARRTAQQEFRAALTDMGLADLADVVDEMIKQDFTTAQIRLELPKTKAYELRFPGMKALRDAKQAISEATYISMEKGYLQTLGAYGLDASVLGSRTELGKYIANLVSPREFEERVDLAATRVKENPDLITQFKVYYPEVDNSALTAYLLDPNKGIDIIKKQVRTAEIGAASVKAGFGITTLGTSAAEALIGATGTSTYAALSQSFARAKELATQQSRLAGIEGTAYQEQEAIGAVVGGDITKTLASQARAEREVSRFAVRGGLTATSLQNTGLNI
jgi:hypothetical protein